MSRLVLQVGSDPTLLQTRREVLRSGGYTVVSAPGLNSALRLLTLRHFDLVLLCHSLQREAQSSLMDFVQQHAPQTQLVVVRCIGESQSGTVTAVDSQPGLLLSQLLDVLSPAPSAMNNSSLGGLNLVQTRPAVSLATRSMQRSASERP